MEEEEEQEREEKEHSHTFILFDVLCDCFQMVLAFIVYS